MRRVAGTILLAVLGLAHTADARTLTQLLSDSRTLALDGSSATRQRFSDTQVTEYLNEAQRLMISQSHCLRQSLTFQLVRGTTYYSLPSNYLSMQRMTIGYKWIQELTPAALDGRSRGWESSSGYPTYYFINYSSRGLVGFAPWPALATDTDTIKMEYDIQATDLVNSSDVPFNSANELVQYNNALAYYAAAMMSLIDNQAARFTSYMQVFTMIETDMVRNCTSNPNYRPSASGSP